MAIEKQLNARIPQKIDTEANWLKAVNFIPKNGEIIVYAPDENYDTPRMKIGDGVTKVNDLPFMTNQSDWNQSDENAIDYIKNKPTEEEAFELLTELNFIEPIANSNGSLFVDNNNALYSL